MNIVKLLRTAIFVENLQWLLLIEKETNVVTEHQISKQLYYRAVEKTGAGGRQGGTISKRNFFFHVKSENIKFLRVNNM